MNATLVAFTESGKFEALEGFLNADADGKTLAEDAARAAGTFNAAVVVLGTSFEKLLDHLTPVVNILTSLTNLATDNFGLSAGIAVTGVAALLGRRQIRKGLGRLFSRRDGAAGGLGAAATASGPTPVFVTNFPVGFGAGRQENSRSSILGPDGQPVRRARYPTARTARRGGLVGRLFQGGANIAGRVANSGVGRTAGRLIGRAGAPLAAVVGAVQVGSSLADGDTRGAASAGGGATGAIAGAAAGAAIGSIVPVIGTAIGGIVGGIAGGLGGEVLASAIYDWIAEDKEKKKEASAKAGDIQLTINAQGKDGKEIAREVGGVLAAGGWNGYTYQQGDFQ